MQRSLSVLQPPVRGWGEVEISESGTVVTSRSAVAKYFATAWITPPRINRSATKNARLRWLSLCG